jgi:hypothetical protein
MHKKYAGKGLVAISLNLDPLKDDEGKDVTAQVKARALKFLQSKGATFTNLLLAEPPVKVGKDEEREFWQVRFDVVGLPAIFVFDRQGKWHRFRGDNNEVDHAKIDALVQKLLAEK